MTWEIEEEEVRQLLALPAADRAVTFFQLAADWEEAWGLKDSAGWIVARETGALPLWPHATFAAACARGAWEGAVPEAVPLGELLEDLLPLLAEDGLAVAVFPAPEEAGIVMPPGEVRERLERELELGEW
jgi:Protein of unknown function (DUF2750)